MSKEDAKSSCHQEQIQIRWWFDTCIKRRWFQFCCMEKMQQSCAFMADCFHKTANGWEHCVHIKRCRHLEWSQGEVFVRKENPCYFFVSRHLKFQAIWLKCIWLFHWNESFMGIAWSIQAHASMYMSTCMCLCCYA